MPIGEFSGIALDVKSIAVGALLYINVTVAVLLPPELVPVIVYVTLPVTVAVNVPLTVPVLGLILRPDGNAGLMV